MKRGMNMRHLISAYILKVFSFNVEVHIYSKQYQNNYNYCIKCKVNALWIVHLTILIIQGDMSVCLKL